ncbi:F-box protein CPR1-like [Actinidia eriantha]|uniref:F-box protein CPR1-like n=1 Tax=Actinidia eriantha TaxID=165200 RepID=UPI002582A28C|nr:F-box protein CPR1-like [Actinidia eriantha]XP_057476188.1 F-box protein CPR1-like [Actinidia eriantha]XP_057476189.1 F-box protein CPR1-like [Actinidia eriantha]
MSQLPEEVLADILSRLPVTQLLRFRCVSASWRALIDGPDFIKLHLNRSIETRTNRGLILREDNHLFEVDLDSLHGGGGVQPEQIDHHPLWCQDYGIEVWGSCNGLVCLSNSLDTLTLWNPSTRRSLRLPYASIEFQYPSRNHEIRIYGFGHDIVSNDYKVVRIVKIKGVDDDSFDYEVKVYSLRSKSWHRTGKFPRYQSLKRTAGVLASNALHWVVTEESEIPMADLIVAFDLGSESYRLVPQPECSDKNFYLYLQSLGGCLSLLCNYFLDRVDVWVMRDYGVKESWNKLFSVAQSSVIRPFQYVRPVAYSRSGGEVLMEQDSSKLIWYDLKQKRVKNATVRGLKELTQAEEWVGSLVPLDGGVESDGKQQQEQEERNIGDFLSTGFKLVL